MSQQAGNQHAFLPADRYAKLLDDRNLGPERSFPVDFEIVQTSVTRDGDVIC